jgi:hypothetical protein
VSTIREGNLTANLADGSGSTDLSLTWQSLCVASPEDSIEDYAAQIVTFTFYPADQPEVQETSGFAVSFNSVGKPQILRLVNSPVDVSEEDGSLNEWLDAPDSGELHVQSATEEPGEINLEEELKQLELLKEQAQQLNSKIKEEDRKIRMHLLNDCSFISSKLKKCKSLHCFIETSFRVVPDVFRLLKYKFGPLPSSGSGSPCQALADDSRRYNNNTTASINATHFTSPFPQYPPSRGTYVRYFIRDVVATLLMIGLVVLSIKGCRNSITCQRTRAYLASRREERRARHAYRAAAFRYRLRLFFRRIFCSGQVLPENTPAQSGPTRTEARRTVEFAVGPADGAAQGTDSTNMGAEILGLRRVLDYVGELVRQNPALRRRQQQLDITDEYVNRSGTPAPSSTAPLTATSSPRTSSVLTYESDSLDTLDSLDVETVTIVSG